MFMVASADEPLLVEPIMGVTFCGWHWGGGTRQKITGTWEGILIRAIVQKCLKESQIHCVQQQALFDTMLKVTDKVKCSSVSRPRDELWHQCASVHQTSSISAFGGKQWATRSTRQTKNIGGRCLSVSMCKGVLCVLLLDTFCPR
jgi:hypothetical protein